MKKTANKLMVVLMVLALALGFMACSNSATKNSKYVGEWKVVTGSYQGVDVNLESIGLNMDMSLKADGTVVVTTAGESGSGQWKEIENGIELTSDGDVITVTDVDGKLQLTEPGSGVIMTLEKQ